MHFDMIFYIHQFSGQPNNSGTGYSYNARCSKKYHATKWTEFEVQHQVVNMKISVKASLRYLCSLKLLNFRKGIRGVVFLLPILGLTWSFGILAVNSAAVVFQYVFTVLNSFQVGRSKK